MVFINWWTGVVCRLLCYYDCRVWKCGELAHTCAVYNFKRHEWYARFLRRYSSVPEEKYALKHELESAKGALNKRINQVDSKHDNKHLPVDTLQCFIQWLLTFHEGVKQ